MNKLKDWITWPVAVVLIAGGLSFTAIALWAPPDAREALLGANSLIWTLIGLYAHQPPAMARRARRRELKKRAKEEAHEAEAAKVEEKNEGTP